jgi:hypothetical protein
LTQQHNQPYDSSLKALFREQTAEVLEYFLDGAHILGELETEVFKPHPPLRVDKAMLMLYRKEPHVVHFEIETGVDKNMPYRMLSYHALLLEQHSLPVISILIYPFATDAIPRSPLEEKSGQEKLLELNYRVVVLGELEAAFYLQQHALPLYPLLPTMHGVTAPMLIEAIDELKEHYEGQKLSRRLLWLRTLLGRTKRLLPKEKQIVEEEINMFDELLDDDPYLKERDRRVAKRIEAQAALQALQKAIVNVVKRRFPTLVTLAEQRVAQASSPDVLEELIVMISTAPDENTARFILSSTVA